MNWTWNVRSNDGAMNGLEFARCTTAGGFGRVLIHAAPADAKIEIIDGDDKLWVVANQADEIVVVDPSGKGIAKLGDFDGIAPDGSPRGLLFPASPVFFGEFVYVTNLALDLRDFNAQFSAVDSQWTAEVTTWNIARISRHLPPVHDREGHSLTK